MGNESGGGGGQDNNPNADDARQRRREAERQENEREDRRRADQERREREASRARAEAKRAEAEARARIDAQKERARQKEIGARKPSPATNRDPDFGAPAPKPSPKMGRSPGAFQAMLGSTGQGARDAAALAGRSEFGSDKAFNALGKMVTEARGDTRILVPSATTAGAAIAKRKMNETMLQKIIAGGKPIFSGDNIVGVDEDGKYTGQASASPYGTKPTIEQQTRDEPVESEPEAPIPDKPSTKMSSAARRKRVSALGSGAGSARQRKFF